LLHQKTIRSGEDSPDGRLKSYLSSKKTKKAARGRKEKRGGKKQ